MSSLREAFYADINSNTLAAFQLDAGVYDTDVFPALGLQKLATVPTDKTVIPLSIRQALRTGRLVILRANVENAGKNRRVPLLCEISKVGTAPAALRNKTMRLGDNNTSWTIKSVIVGGNK